MNRRINPDFNKQQPQLKLRYVPIGIAALVFAMGIESIVEELLCLFQILN